MTYWRSQMPCFAFHLSGLNCFTSDIQTMPYPSMLIQSSRLVLCLVSLIILNKPPSHNSTLLPLLFPPCPPTSAPIPFPGTCPITVTVIAPAWVIPQCVRAGDTEPAPPRCVLWQQRVSAATADDVRMPPRGGHHPLSLCFSVHYTDSMGCCSVLCGRKALTEYQGM